MTAKTIKENIARAKNYASRSDYLRCLTSLAKALELLLASKVFGREKFEIEFLLEELLREVSGMEALKRALPGGLQYKRGEERKLYHTVCKLRDKLEEVIGKARLKKLREEKMTIDDMIIGAQDLLKQNEPMEARKLFRRVSETFGEQEPGIFSDIGNRLMMAGLFQEAIEYFERGKDAYPKDSRPYTGLINCWEGLGEMDKAEDAVQETMRKFGANESLYLKLARLAVAKRKWSEAFDAANNVLRANPLNMDAQKILKAVEPRIYGRAGGGAAAPAGGGASSGAKPSSAPTGGGKAIKLDF